MINKRAEILHQKKIVTKRKKIQKRRRGEEENKMHLSY